VIDNSVSRLDISQVVLGKYLCIWFRVEQLILDLELVLS